LEPLLGSSDGPPAFLKLSTIGPIAKIYLNDELLGSTENLFRTYYLRIPSDFKI
jgi:hypothetical protein